MTNMLLLGCGKMGGAILHGMLSKNIPWNYFIYDPHLAKDSPFLKYDNVTQIHTLSDAQNICVILLAVKPQIMGDVLTELHKADLKTALVISIAAGKTLKTFHAALPDQAAIIRSMPNTPGSIGAGITVALSDQPLSAEHHMMATQVLEALGTLIWIKDEAQLDAVTALSGSGPAYVFHLCEVMASAGEKMGLPTDVAMTLARETIIGSALLMKESPDSASTLREAVTSPGGTTAAALDVLRGGDAMKMMFEKALLAAQKRSRELS